MPQINTEITILNTMQQSEALCQALQYSHQTMEIQYFLRFYRYGNYDLERASHFPATASKQQCQSPNTLFELLIPKFIFLAIIQNIIFPTFQNYIINNIWYLKGLTSQIIHKALFLDVLLSQEFTVYTGRDINVFSIYG